MGKQMAFVALALCMAFSSCCISAIDYDAAIKKELSENYSGMYEGEKWTPWKQMSNKEIASWKEKLEKRGYRFVKNGNETIVYSPDNINLATIFDEKSVSIEIRYVSN